MKGIQGYTLYCGSLKPHIFQETKTSIVPYVSHIFTVANVFRAMYNFENIKHNQKS